MHYSISEIKAKKSFNSLSIYHKKAYVDFSPFNCHQKLRKAGNFLNTSWVSSFLIIMNEQ